MIALHARPGPQTSAREPRARASPGPAGTRRGHLRATANGRSTRAGPDRPLSHPAPWSCVRTLLRPHQHAPPPRASELVSASAAVAAHPVRQRTGARCRHRARAPPPPLPRRPVDRVPSLPRESPRAPAARPSARHPTLAAAATARLRVPPDQCVARQASSTARASDQFAIVPRDPPTLGRCLLQTRSGE